MFYNAFHSIQPIVRLTGQRSGLFQGAIQPVVLVYETPWPKALVKTELIPSHKSLAGPLALKILA